MHTAFLLALLGLVGLAVAAFVTGRGSLLLAGGGFLGVLLSAGLRWRWASGVPGR